MMQLRVADLFCGTGGFSHGFIQTGEFDVVLGIDIKPQSVQTFAANHPRAEAICEDIRALSVEDVAKRLGGGRKTFDVLIGGPPCQGFSSIRPYRSVNEDDHRNTLFEQFIAFLEFFEPRFVVFENVVGLSHHKGGKTLTKIRAVIESVGYATSVGVLNAVNYGVPQRRERVIVLGRRGKQAPSLPVPTHGFNGRGMGGDLAFGTMSLFDRDLPDAITVEQAIGDLPAVGAGETAGAYDEDALLTDYTAARRKACAQLTLHTATRHTPRMLQIIRMAGRNRWALPDGLTSSGFSSCYSRLDADEPSTTLTVNFVHPASNRCIHPTQDRALTVREGARLQSFDDEFIFRGSRTKITKQIGEAVPPLLGQAIAGSVLEQW